MPWEGNPSPFTLDLGCTMQVGIKLVVLNLSQQTDSSDLVGGFKPVQPRDALLPLLDTFQGLVRYTWSKGNNEDFLGRVAKYAQRQKWAPLLQAFQTAIQKVQLGGLQLAPQSRFPNCIPGLLLATKGLGTSLKAAFPLWTAWLTGQEGEGGAGLLALVAVQSSCRVIWWLGMSIGYCLYS